VKANIMKTNVIEAPLQNVGSGVLSFNKIDLHIRSKLEKQEGTSEDFVSCQVMLEVPHKYQHQDKQLNVRIEIRVSKNEIVVNRDHPENIYDALRVAFDAAKSQLASYLCNLNHQTIVQENEYVDYIVQKYSKKDEEMQSVNGMF
jgi:ribosome-associated translation inhibitor RaiA